MSRIDENLTIPPVLINQTEKKNEQTEIQKLPAYAIMQESLSLAKTDAYRSEKKQVKAEFVKIKNALENELAQLAKATLPLETRIGEKIDALNVQYAQKFLEYYDKKMTSEVAKLAEMDQEVAALAIHILLFAEKAAVGEVEGLITAMDRSSYAKAELNQQVNKISEIYQNLVATAQLFYGKGE